MVRFSGAVLDAPVWEDVSPGHPCPKCGATTGCSVLSHDEFVRCLPISGVDGTLEKRMTEAAMQYRVRAKTGFIKEVSALSGYALAGEAGDQEVFAFSFVINGFKGANAEMKRIQDDLCRAVVALPRAAGE